MSTVLENKHAFADGLLTRTKISLAEDSVNEALNVLASTAMPTRRTEAWKYTRVSKLGKIDFTSNPLPIAELSNFLIDKSTYTVVFVNGYYSEQLSSELLPDGVVCKPFSQCSKDELNSSNVPLESELFNALNTAYLNDGILIDIAPKTVLKRPIQIIHITKGTKQLANFRTIIKAGAFTNVAIIQGFFSEDAELTLTNSVSEIFIDQGAFLKLDKIQFEEESTSHISTERIHQSENSTFTMNTITLNGGLVRNSVCVEVNGENCTTNLNGAYLLKGKQHVDNHTIVDHKAPNCNSNELYKGVIDDKATAVFNGKVYVRKDAQKINAFQSNGNVLLSDNATVNSKPELEIYADDVKCSHGSTTGQLDEEAVFYLRTRGLSEKSARKLIVGAFIGEVLEKIEDDNVLNYVHELLTSRFGWELS